MKFPLRREMCLFFIWPCSVHPSFPTMSDKKCNSLCSFIFCCATSWVSSNNRLSAWSCGFLLVWAFNTDWWCVTNVLMRSSTLCCANMAPPCGNGRCILFQQNGGKTSYEGMHWDNPRGCTLFLLTSQATLSRSSAAVLSCRLCWNTLDWYFSFTSCSRDEIWNKRTHNRLMDVSKIFLITIRRWIDWTLFYSGWSFVCLKNIETSYRNILYNCPFLPSVQCPLSEARPTTWRPSLSSVAEPDCL